MAIGKITSNSLAADAVTSTKIAPGVVNDKMSDITVDKLHTTLDLSTKTLTLPQASVTAHQSALRVTQSQISDLSTNSDDLTEGSTNLFFTDARADARAQLKVDAIVGSVPGTLDTLQELGDALGDDPNFATTVTNSIATKLPLAGGTITGPLQLTTGPLQLTASGTPTITSPTNIIFNVGSGNGIINFSGSKVMNLGDPVDAQDAAPKSYVDSVNYTDSAVDTHLNIDSAAADQVLAWSGTDYQWVPQASGSGGGGGGDITANNLYLDEDIKLKHGTGSIKIIRPAGIVTNTYGNEVNVLEHTWYEQKVYQEYMSAIIFAMHEMGFTSDMFNPWGVDLNPVTLYQNTPMLMSAEITIHIVTYYENFFAGEVGAEFEDSQIIQGYLMHNYTTATFTETSNTCTDPGVNLITLSTIVYNNSKPIAMEWSQTQAKHTVVTIHSRSAMSKPPLNPYA